MIDNSGFDTRADPGADFWTEQDEAMQQRYMFNSEGEDLGAALSYVACGAAILCAGIAVAAIIVRS